MRIPGKLPNIQHRSNEEAIVLRNRLRKIMGQLRVVEKMLMADRKGADILMQLMSGRKALKGLSEKIIHSNIQECLVHGKLPIASRKKIQDLIEVLDRYVD